MKQFVRATGLLLLVWMLLTAPGYGSMRLKIGDTPPVRLGRSVKLSDYRGKVVIISFWASWCPPCRQEMSVLANIQKAATRDKVVIFAVNWREHTETFLRIQHTLHNVDLTLLSDADGEIGEEYGVDAIPHMVIVGRDGRVAAIHVGYGEGEIPLLAKEINALWAQRAAPSSPQPTSNRNVPTPLR
jgi:thiol-disulfide isomerase/thioredoxin